jgi:hypothetical protein
MNAKAPIEARIKVKKHAFAARELRRAEDNATLTGDLAAFLFQHDSGAVKVTLEALLDPESHVGEDTIFIRIPEAGGR